MAKKKPGKKPKVTKEKTVAAKARVLQSRIAASGKTSRVKGHLSASTKRTQAKRDSKNS